MAMDFDDLVKAKFLEKEEHGGWGGNIALYIIGAVIIIAIFAYLWNKNSNEKAEFATGIANLQGRVNAIEPVLTAQGNNIFSLNGVVASTVQGVKDMKETFGYDLAGLNDAVFAPRARTGCGGCGNREFKQSQVYNLASTTVTVDETCRN
jgi:hypothetical protein